MLLGGEKWWQWWNRGFPLCAIVFDVSSIYHKCS
jgi:hypothetical protein